MRRIRPLSLVLVLVLCTAGAAQAGNPFYLVGKIGNSTLDDNLGDSLGQIFDGDDESWGAGLGFKLGKYLAFQAEYQDLGSVPGIGSPCDAGAEGCVLNVIPVEADSTAVTVTVLPQLPIGDRFYLYGKFGFVSYDADVSAIEDVGDRFIDNFDDEDLVYGGGLRYLLPGPIDVFVEYESISDVFETVSVGATLGF